MFRRFSVDFAVLSLVLDAALTFLALLTAVRLRPSLPELPFLVTVERVDMPWELFLAIPLLWIFIFLLGSVYDPKRAYRIVDELQNVLLATGLAALVFAGILYLWYRDFSRWLFVLFVLLNLVLLVGWRLLARLFYRLATAPTAERRVLIVGTGDVGRRMGEMVAEYYWMGLKLVGYLAHEDSPSAVNGPILGTLEDAPHVVRLHNIEDVVVTLPQSAYAGINQLILALHELPVHLRIVPDYFSLALYRASVDDFGGVPMINLRDPALNDVQRMAKRAADLVLGSTLVLFSLPLLGLVALAVKLDSDGPVLFRQQRVGENGRLFCMYKFRSMVNGADKIKVIKENGNRVVHKSANDPRVTRVGRILRRTSLDELPQLFNVLKGDMSLVGPRPELPWLVDRYEPWQRKRFAVPQGMTGWWQVNGRSNNPLHQNTEDDLYYIQNYSIWLDFYILLRTFWVVLRGKGAY